MSCDMWFGTQEYATWIPTPLRGADVSAQGWGESGSFLNGGAFAFNSYNTHKEFDFSWRSTSSRKDAQTMMSFYSGTFGRGKLYFLDPLTMQTNVLPARWADPSITCDFEGESLVPGVDPLRVSQTNTDRLQLPVTAAQYDLSGITEVETAFNAEATNLFTNPNLVGDGTWAEVARNRLPAAIPSSAWQVQPGTSGAVTTDPDYLNSGFRGFYCRWDTVPTGGNVAVFPANSSGSIVTVTPGEVIPISVKAISQRPRVRIFAEWYTSGGAWIAVAANSDYVTVANDPANPTLISVVTDEAPANAARLYVRVMPAFSEMLAGDRIVVGEVMIGHGEYFNGSTTPETAVGVDQPEDFRWRWLGAENASESVMEIERVRGLSASNGVMGVSSFDGRPAARQIPTSTTADVYSTMSPITGSKTLIVTICLKTPLTNIGNPTNSRRTYLTGPPTTFGPQAPNEPGTFQSRLTTDVNGTIVLNNGNRLGGGDVWWTDIGLFAGEYDGEAFSGDSEVPGKITRWTGAPNASPSEIGHLTLSTPSVISESNALFVPLPDGMQLNVGAFYQSTTAGQGVYVTPATRGGGNTGVVTRLTPITSSAADTLPNTFTKTPGVIGVWVWIGKTAQGSGVVTVNAIHARVFPLGSTSTGETHWYGGQGNEGVRFLQPPTYINQTGVDGGQIEFAATFTEVSF